MNNTAIFCKKTDNKLTTDKGEGVTIILSARSYNRLLPTKNFPQWDFAKQTEDLSRSQSSVHLKQPPSTKKHNITPKRTNRVIQFDPSDCQ